MARSPETGKRTNLKDVFVVFPQRRAMRDGQERDAEICDPSRGYAASVTGRRYRPLPRHTGSMIVERLFNLESHGTRALVENRVLEANVSDSTSFWEELRQLTLGRW